MKKRIFTHLLIFLLTFSILVSSVVWLSSVIEISISSNREYEYFLAHNPVYNIEHIYDAIIYQNILNAIDYNNTIILMGSMLIAIILLLSTTILLFCAINVVKLRRNPSLIQEAKVAKQKREIKKKEEQKRKLQDKLDSLD